jgi:hypothetical protein
VYTTEAAPPKAAPLLHQLSVCPTTPPPTDRFVQARPETDQLLDIYLSLLTSGPMGAYAMCLFFLLAGLFTPGSYNRKGAWKHVQVSCAPPRRPGWRGSPC